MIITWTTTLREFYVYILWFNVLIRQCPSPGNHVNVLIICGSCLPTVSPISNIIAVEIKALIALEGMVLQKVCDALVYVLDDIFY